MNECWIKTDAGQQAFKSRSAQLAGKLRSAYLLFDGKRTVQEVLDATQGLGVSAEDLDALRQAGFLSAPENTPTSADVQAAMVQLSVRTPQERYRDAYPLAVALTGKLGLSGFRLNLLVEGASGYEELAAVAPKIKEAVGSQAYAPLEEALFA